MIQSQQRITANTQVPQPAPNEKIRLTKDGILFSGPSAFLSKLSPADFVFENTPYNSTEHSIQHLNASHHLEFEIGEEVNSIELKLGRYDKFTQLKLSDMFSKVLTTPPSATVSSQHEYTQLCKDSCEVNITLCDFTGVLLYNN